MGFGILGFYVFGAVVLTWFNSQSEKQQYFQTLAFREVSGMRIVQSAMRLARSENWKYCHDCQNGKGGFDCSGLVLETLKTIGVTIVYEGSDNGVKQIFDWCNKNKFPVEFRVPATGDIVFWNFTRPLKAGGPLAPLSHCGIVQTVFWDNSFIVLEAANTQMGIRSNIYELKRMAQNGTWKLVGFSSVRKN